MTKIKIVRYFDVPEDSRLHEVIFLWLKLLATIGDEERRVFISNKNKEAKLKRLKKVKNITQEHVHVFIRRLDTPEDFYTWSYSTVNNKGFGTYDIKYHPERIKFRVTEVPDVA